MERKKKDRGGTVFFKNVNGLKDKENRNVPA